jgi:hypothetical protein
VSTSASSAKARLPQNLRDLRIETEVPEVLKHLQQNFGISAVGGPCFEGVQEMCGKIGAAGKPGALGYARADDRDRELRGPEQLLGYVGWTLGLSKGKTLLVHLIVFTALHPLQSPPHLSTMSVYEQGPWLPRG